MAARMIFYKHPDNGVETMQFCPVVKIGCRECFFNRVCKGEQKEKAIAFKLRFYKDRSFTLKRIKPCEH